MSGHRLLVRRGGRLFCQGTGFWVRPDCVVTALHVIVEEDPEALLHVRVGETELLLTLLLKDDKADLVLLRAASPGEALPVVNTAPGLGERWSALGFPAEEGGQPFSLTGTLAARYAADQARALQLTVEQGTVRNWEGMSGAPVLVGGAVAGVITQEKDAANTMWAASSEALVGLLRLHDRFEATAALLAELYGPETLPALARDLSAPGPEPAAILGAARLEGEAGLRRLLDEMRQDFPQHAGLRALAEQGQGNVQGRKRLISEICQKVADGQGTGVALIVPLGFDGTRLAEAALDALASSFLVLRLVPPRDAVDEARLYPTLLGFLRQSLVGALGSPLDPAWSSCLPPVGAPANEEDFRACLAGLLEGPVRSSGRRLLLAVDGLSRLPEEQRRRWGYTMAALGRREGWRLLVWGGEELHLLCHKAGGEGAFSVFHSLHPVSVPPLDLAEVKDTLRAGLGAADDTTADRVFQATGGHPALVAELLEMWPDGASCPELEDLSAAVAGSLTLERAGEGLDPKAKDALAKLVRAGGSASPFLLGQGGQRLRWLGLAVEDKGKLRILAPGVAEWARGVLA